MLPSSPSKLKLSFDTVFYYVTGMDASIAFYRDTLGLPMVSHDYVATLRSRWRAHRTRAPPARIGKGGKLAFFRDPDGNELCLWEYAEPEDAREIVKSALLHG